MSETETFNDLQGLQEKGEGSVWETFFKLRYSMSIYCQEQVDLRFPIIRHFLGKHQLLTTWLISNENRHQFVNLYLCISSLNLTVCFIFGKCIPPCIVTCFRSNSALASPVHTRAVPPAGPFNSTTASWKALRSAGKGLQILPAASVLAHLLQNF